MTTNHPFLSSLWLSNEIVCVCEFVEEVCVFIQKDLINFEIRLVKSFDDSNKIKLDHPAEQASNSSDSSNYCRIAFKYVSERNKTFSEIFNHIQMFEDATAVSLSDIYKLCELFIFIGTNTSSFAVISSISLFTSFSSFFARCNEILCFDGRLRYIATLTRVCLLAARSSAWW